MGEERLRAALEGGRENRRVRNPCYWSEQMLTVFLANNNYDFLSEINRHV